MASSADALAEGAPVSGVHDRPPFRNPGPGRYDRTKSAAERNDEQRRRLVESARVVFSREGFAQASVEKILEVADLSRATFYKHFADLPDVFDAVQMHAAELMYQQIADAVNAEAHPPERLRAGITAFLRVLGENGDLCRVFLREARGSGRDHHGLRSEVVRRAVLLVREGCAAAVSGGLLQREPDDLTISALLFAIEGVGVSYLDAHREAEAIAAAPTLAALCFRALV